MKDRFSLCSVCAVIWWTAFPLPFAFAQNPQIDNTFFGVIGQKAVPPTTTRAPAKDAVSVKIAPGEIRGKKTVVYRVPWQPDRDWREQQLARERIPDQTNFLPRENNIDVYEFLGIPYGVKPVGNLRFKPPERLTQFPDDGIVEAYSYPNSCAQDQQRISTFKPDKPYPWKVDEDCLYLNIFTPEVGAYTARMFPVLVFFHGGGFQTGTANEWPGHVLASKGLVVVTVNYRLGAFGFMTLGEWSGANMGLLDQRLALQWVRDYIFAFNGDINRILLAGHGAGAVSAGLHMLSPGSANLFHAVAAFSGADVSYHQVIWDIQLAFNNTIRLGRESGCAQTTATATYNCILTRSTNDIIVATSQMRLEYNRYPFMPAVDRKFLPDNPRMILERKQVTSPVPYLTGVNQYDGTQALFEDRLSDIRLADLNFKIDNNYITSKIVRYVLQHNYTTNRDAIIQAIKYLYTYWPDPLNDNRMREEYLKMVSDAYYVAPVQLSARLHSDAGSLTYMYVNNYKLNTGTLNPQRKRPFPDWMGVFHEVDLYLLFGFPFMTKDKLPPTFPRDEMEWSQADYNASDNFMEQVRQFARRKDPNLPSDNTWSNLNVRDQYYLDFNVTRKMYRDYDWEHVSFWNIYIEQVAELWTTTLDPTVASIKRELEIMKGVSGTFIVLAAIFAVVMGALAYVVCNYRDIERYERRQLILESQVQPGNSERHKRADHV